VNTVTLNTTILAALAKHIAPKTDVRYYLNGVHLEISHDGVTYVATDGHKLLAAHEGLEKDDYVHAPFTLIIPRDVCIAIAKGTNKFPTATLKYERSDAECRMENVRSGVQVFKAIDGKFPDWKRVMPIEVKHGDHAEFNPDYLSDLFAAAKAITDNDKPCMTVFHNGKLGAPVVFGDTRLAGVIMPWVMNLLPEYPAWIARTPELKAAA